MKGADVVRCSFRPLLSAPSQRSHPWLSRIQQRASQGDGGVGGCGREPRKTTAADEGRAAANWFNSGDECWNTISLLRETESGNKAKEKLKKKIIIKNLLIQSRCSFNYSAAISSIQFNFIYTTALTIRTVSGRAIQAKLGTVEELNLSIKYYRKKWAVSCCF